MRTSASAKAVEVQSSFRAFLWFVTGHSSIRNPLAFEKAWRGRGDAE